MKIKKLIGNYPFRYSIFIKPYLHLLVTTRCGGMFRLCLRYPISFFTGYTIFIRPTVDSWNLLKVAVRYGCRGFPLECIDLPRILFGDFPFVHAPEEVKDEYQLCESERERAHRDKDVHIRKSLFLGEYLH